MVRSAAWSGVLCLALAPAAWAQSGRELEGRVERLEKELQDLKGQLQERRAADEAECKARVDAYLKEARPADGTLEAVRRRVHLGGYVTAMYHNLGDLGNDEPFDRNFDAFTLKRVVLGLDADITDKLTFSAEIEFEQEILESWLAERRGINVDEVELEQARLDWELTPVFNLRLGQLLVPFGKYNANHDDFLHELPDRPLVDTFIIPTAWSETGVSAYGTLNFTEEAFLTWDLAVVNGLNERIEDQNPQEEHHAFSAARGDIGADNNNDKAVVGRLGVHPLANLELGLSGYTGVYRDRGGERVNGGAFDYRWDFLDHFTLQGEAAAFDIERPSDQFLNLLYLRKQAEGEFAAAFPRSTWGLYSELDYRFFPEFLKDTFLGHGLENPTLEAVFRYDYARVDDVFPETPGSWDEVFAGRVRHAFEDRLTLALGYRPSPAAIFTVGYMWNSGEMQYRDGDGFFLGASVGF